MKLFSEHNCLDFYCHHLFSSESKQKTHLTESHKNKNKFQDKVRGEHRKTRRFEFFCRIELGRTAAVNRWFSVNLVRTGDVPSHLSAQQLWKRVVQGAEDFYITVG